MESSRRGQLTLIDLLMLAGLPVCAVLLFISFLVPTREGARRRQCQYNLRHIGRALQAYEDANGTLPPAAIQPDSMDVLELVYPRGQMVATHANWLTLLLPHLGQAELAGRFNRNAPITDWSNKAVREAELSVLACPADTFHNANNHFQALLQVSGSGMSTASASGQARSKTAAAPVVDFARGNYAINMGTSATVSAPGTCRYPVPCGTMTERKERHVLRWGNGVAGVNKAFASKEFVNRLGTTVAVDEIRSGLRCVDSRGAWALGLIGCSATYGHGLYGDAAGPNPDRAAADEIIGCGQLGALIKYGSVVADENMRCRDCQVASQAAARSLHLGGVNVLMLDGSACFVGDGVDLGLWHAMHSRETQEPISLRSVDLEPQSNTNQTVEEYGKTELDYQAVARAGGNSPSSQREPKRLINAIGMELIQIAPGEFVMGMPDQPVVNRCPRGPIRYPSESAPHWVRIRRPFCLGTYKVTQGQYEQVMGVNPSWHSATGGDKQWYAAQDTIELPVEQVSWHDAVEFCRRLSLLAAEQTTGRTYRLPTEAEWEFAGRAGSVTVGDGHPSGAIGPVSQDEMNAWFLHGMCGGVCEWCADWYARDYYVCSDRDDPRGPPTGYLRVVRGTPWIFTGDPLQRTTRAAAPWATSRFIGFRVACDVGEGR